MTVPWKNSLLQSLEKNSKLSFSKFFQLATVKPDGKPANRTVVYRGFDSESERILFTTDTRTKKMDDFKKQPWAEICWYFTDTREQYRLSGKISVIDANAEDKAQRTRQENWEDMSTSLRAWFGGPPPGAHRSEEKAFEKEPPAASDPPVPSFAVVQMDVREVDYVDLVSNKRQNFTKSGLDWKEQALNP